MTIDVIAAARRRTRRLVIAVLIGAGVLALAVYPAGLYVNSRLDDGAPSTTAAAPAPWPASSGAVVLPADVTWVSVAGVALPVSATAGPRDLRDGLARGFAHTPAGAVLAAVHLLVRTTAQAGPNVFTPTLHDQVVGDHAAAMRAFVADSYRQLAGDTNTTAPVGSLPAALAGVRIDSYTDQAASLDLLTTAVDATGTPRFAATAIQLRWIGADWALVAPEQGRWDHAVRSVTTAQAAAYPPLAQGR
jgi:hypothetical protein